MATKTIIQNPWFKLHMPYGILRTTQPGHVWLPFNRSYKPLGVPFTRWVDYDKYALENPEACFHFKRDPTLFKGVWPSRNENAFGDYMLFLYPGTAFAEEYFPALAKLMDHRLFWGPYARRQSVEGLSPHCYPGMPL